MTTQRKRRLGIAAVVIALCIGAIFVLVHFLSGSSTGIAQVGTALPAIDKPGSPVVVDTSYYTTALPAGFVIKKQIEDPSRTALLSLVATDSIGKSMQFASTVGNLPSEGLRGVGDYNVRITQTESYQPYVPVGLPAGAIAFRSTSSANAFTVFMIRDARYVELSFSSDGGDSYAQLQTIYDQINAAWQWK